MVFEIIAGVLVICQIASGARRIELHHRELGRAVKKQGFIFLFSNIGSSICYCLMGRHLLVFGHLTFVPCLFAQLAFYSLTEMLPLLSFVQLQNKFVEINGLGDQPPAALAGANQNNNNQVEPAEGEAAANDNDGGDPPLEGEADPE